MGRKRRLAILIGIELPPGDFDRWDFGTDNFGQLLDFQTALKQDLEGFSKQATD